MGEDKFGGRPVNISRALRFQECLDTCRLIDIGFSGPHFTWSNHRPLTDLIQERINRIFANAEWNKIYPEANVKHLERVQSDHCPILVCLEHSQQARLQRPFRFQPIWLSHPDFPNVVRDAWINPVVLANATATFTEKARVWNKEVFGNIFHRKKRVVARHRGVQTALSTNPNNFLVDLERDLRKKFTEILKLEEELWAMKS